jgi:peptide/nickel transport system ATP-binding protein
MATGTLATPAEPLPESSAPLPEEAAPPAPPPPGDDAILTIKDLRTYFYTYDGVVKALDGVSLKIRRGQTTGLVGETGCGKSVTAFSVTRLISDPPGRIMGGKVTFDGANLLWRLETEAKYVTVPNSPRVKVKRYFRRIRAADLRMTSIRGRRIAMIFQEPSQAMNPVFSISNQLSEVLLLHRGTEIIDAMLAATPNNPAVAAAIGAVESATARRQREELITAAQHLGEVAGSESFGTEAYHTARASPPGADDLKPRLLRAMGRLRLSPSQRQYLAHRRRLMVLQRELSKVSLEEMRTETPKNAERRAIQRKILSERARHFYYGLWGIRSRVQRPLNTETFWRTVRLLEGVSIANPAQVARGYPHELSGGMLQRVMIAMALSSDPDVLIADEPTTALDVTIQAQILELMRDLKHRVGTSILLITHDLAVIAEVADRVCVMYAGQIVEQGPVADVFRQPLHPYAQGLLASIPRFDQPDKELQSIPGSVPNLITPPSGCRFHPRCPHAMPVCKGERPPMTVEGPDHTVACYLYTGPVAAE